MPSTCVYVCVCELCNRCCLEEGRVSQWSTHTAAGIFDYRSLTRVCVLCVHKTAACIHSRGHPIAPVWPLDCGPYC